jgi:hypothetical protein
MNADGTGRTKVTPVTYVDQYANWPFLIWTDFYSMDWSPDGTQIVFQDNYDIVIVKTDGSNRHAITDGPRGRPTARRYCSQETLLTIHSCTGD